MFDLEMTFELEITLTLTLTFDLDHEPILTFDLGLTLK